MIVRSVLRRRRKPLIVVAVLAVFVIALLIWTRGSSPSAPAFQASSSVPTATPPGGSVTSPAGSTATAANPTPAVALTLPTLPQSSSINDATAPEHSVLLIVKSDAAILQVGWAVKDNHVRGNKAVNVESPFRVLTVGRGYGAIAVIGAQASPFATYISCSITVDGQLRYAHTAHGPWSVTSCLG